jgi:hypothetical protein
VPSSFFLFSPSLFLRFLLLPYSIFNFVTSLFYLYYSPFHICELMFSFTHFLPFLCICLSLMKTFFD